MSDLHTHTEWSPTTLAQHNHILESCSPETILQWGCNTFGRGLVTATGFGPSGIVLMHHLSRLDPGMTFFYLETDLLFSETYALRDELSRRLGITFTAIPSSMSLDDQAERYGPSLWARKPDHCCFLRKVLPLRHYLVDKGAWITGIRRDQSSSRAETKIVEWDEANGLIKLNPLAMWTTHAVWEYIHLHTLPYNSLHDEGYPSIGCMPCSRPVLSGEDARAGRWSGFDKMECGIHLQHSVA